MSNDSPEKQALDAMEELCRMDAMPKDRLTILGMLWRAFELGKQRQGFINIPEIEPVTKRCVYPKAGE
jgi:hypothetical protein